MAALRATLARWLPNWNADAGTELPDGRDKPEKTALAETRPAIDGEVIESLHELDEHGAMDAACELFETFLGTADWGIAKAESALSAGDYRTLAELAGALELEAAQVGALILSGCYRELEALAGADRIDEACAMLDRIRREHARAVAQMRELLLEIG
jgi:hypothetical protein